MVKVGIINATGYAGAEITRILALHPEVKITCVTGRTHVGKRLGEVFPHLAGLKLRIEENFEDTEESIDFVFSALPHAASAEKLMPFIDAGIPCVDISADFRLKDEQVYRKWYDTEHPCPQFIKRAVYGLPEIYRSRIRDTKLVANPGCFPTGAILSVVPSLKEGIISPDIINDSKTGVSGAGRSAKAEYGFSELNDNAVSYALSGHRHIPEMIQTLKDISGENIRMTFVPSLTSMTRGILGVSYASLNRDMNTHELMEIYSAYYKDEPFIRVVNAPPAAKHTRGSNHVLIYPTTQEGTDQLIVVTVLDNLVKGAAGAAVQNMNIMLGFEETTGLEFLPLYP